LRIEIAVEGMKNENLPMQETKVLKILLSYTDAVVPTQQPKIPSASILMPWSPMLRLSTCAGGGVAPESLAAAK
jgi:hypothetical protein